MLIQNNTQLLFSLYVSLTFDNGSTKDCKVNPGDYLLLKFRYNGNKLYRACKVLGIQPIILNTQPESYAASLLVDCSTKFNAERLKVSSMDILNIRRVDADYIASLAPEFNVTEDMINADATPATPDELYKRPGVEIAGVGEARIIR